MKKITILCILLLCVVTDTMAQKTVTVSGIVSDSNKEPLIGEYYRQGCSRIRSHY